MFKSLVKLPFIFLVATSLRVLGKRPNPPVPKNEQASSGLRETMIAQMTNVKDVFWVAAFAETVLILGQIIWPRGNGENPFYLTPVSVIGASMAVAASKGHKLITHGPYAFVRHPSYTGSVVALVGAILWYFSPGSLLGAPTSWASSAAAICLFTLLVVAMAMIVMRIEEEDKLLRQRFGAEWDAWAQKVSYKLVPYVY